jgi:hypothetical protein
MTICEFFKNKFDGHINNPNPVIRISDEVEKGSYEWVKCWADYVCGGAFEGEYLNSGITKEQLKEAVSNKFLKHIEHKNWEAKQRGKTDAYELTAKGLKAFHKYYQGKF